MFIMLNVFIGRVTTFLAPQVHSSVRSIRLVSPIVFVVAVLLVVVGCVQNSEASIVHSHAYQQVNCQRSYALSGASGIAGQSPRQVIADLNNDAIPIRESPMVAPAEPQTETSAVDLSGLTQVSIQLTGPMCSVCLRRLEGRLITLPGVALAKVEPPPAPTDEELKNPGQLKKRTALVSLAYDPSKVSIGKIKEWIIANDFQVKSITKQK